MSNKANHRRAHQRRRSENATFDGPPCGNARDKAKGRRKWKQRRRRTFRRNGYESRKVHGKGKPYEALQLALEEAGFDTQAQRGRNSGRRQPSGRKWRLWQRRLARKLRRSP